MKTGNTSAPADNVAHSATPQWSPVMKTGNTCGARVVPLGWVEASMEPGHEDREYASHAVTRASTAGLNGARS